MIRWKIAQFFEIGWWKNYLGKSDSTSYLNWKRAYWSDFFEKIEVKILPNDIVLDAGCGPAGIFIIIKNAQVFCIDALLDKYTKLKVFVPEDYENCHFENIPIEQINFELKFEKVFCINAINHVNNLNTTWKRLSKSLKNNGILIVSIDCHKYDFFKWLFRLIPFDLLHPHQFNLEEYKAMSCLHGLKIVRELKLSHNFFFDYFVLVCEKP